MLQTNIFIIQESSVDKQKGLRKSYKICPPEFKLHLFKLKYRKQLSFCCTDPSSLSFTKLVVTKPTKHYFSAVLNTYLHGW
jgi:hypothetical protein